MTNIGAAMAGGNGNRRKDDFYATKDLTLTLALLRTIRFHENIWECACGEGHMSRVLEMEGYNVKSTDLVNRGYGETGVDFLECTEPFEGSIITNPPFKHAEKFIRKAATLVPTFAFLLPINFWCAKTRIPLYEELPPSCQFPLWWRLDTTGAGRPTMSLQWVVWGAQPESIAAAMRPLPRPSLSDLALFG